MSSIPTPHLAIDGMAPNHLSSHFSYSLTKPYPYRWFTPVTLVGGVVALVLVSFLNVATSGYELKPISTTNRTAVLSGKVWFKNWPDWLVSTRASCEVAELSLQTGLYTNNTAFFYNLIAAWTYSPATSTRDEDKVNLGSLLYEQNPLESCNISTIKIQVESAEGRPAGSVSVQQLGATVTANVQCLISKDDSPTYLQLVTTYDPIPPANEPTSVFLNANTTHKASLYWGQSIMRLYWSQMLMEYYEVNSLMDPPYYKAEITLYRDSTQPATSDSIKSVDFLTASACWFLYPNATGIHNGNGFCKNGLLSVLAAGDGMSGAAVPGIWVPLANLARAMWFTVLADLGRDDGDGGYMPNALASPDLLQSLTADLSAVNASLTPGWRWGLLSASRSQVPYVASSDGTSQLEVVPSVLTTSYACLIPRLKSGGALFFAVLIADLVLLQAIWKGYKFTVDYFWVGKQSGAMHCEGCAELLRESKILPLQDVSSNVVDGGRSSAEGFTGGLPSAGLSARQSLLGNSH